MLVEARAKLLFQLWKDRQRSTPGTRG